MLFQDIFSCVFFKIFLDQSQWHHFQTPSWTSNTLWVLLCCNSLQTWQTCTYLQRGVFWFLRSDVFMLPVHFHFYGPQALFSVRRDVRTLRGLVHQRIRSLQLFHVPQRHQWNHRFANVWSFFRIRVVEDKDVQVLEDGKRVESAWVYLCNTTKKCCCTLHSQEGAWQKAMTRKRKLRDSYDKKNLRDNYDNRKTAESQLWQEKDSWQKAMTREIRLGDSNDNWETAMTRERKLGDGYGKRNTADR